MHYVAITGFMVRLIMPRCEGSYKSTLQEVNFTEPLASDKDENDDVIAGPFTRYMVKNLNPGDAVNVHRGGLPTGAGIVVERIQSGCRDECHYTVLVGGQLIYGLEEVNLWIPSKDPETP
jgi:hypothetical protein